MVKYRRKEKGLDKATILYLPIALLEEFDSAIRFDYNNRSEGIRTGMRMLIEKLSEKRRLLNEEQF